VTVPLFDTSAPLAPLRTQLREAIERVLEREDDVVKTVIKP